jgi:hypothetical protein
MTSRDSARLPLQHGNSILIDTVDTRLEANFYMNCIFATHSIPPNSSNRSKRDFLAQILFLPVISDLQLHAFDALDALDAFASCVMNMIDSEYVRSPLPTRVRNACERCRRHKSRVYTSVMIGSVLSMANVESNSKIV